MSKSNTAVVLLVAIAMTLSGFAMVAGAAPADMASVSQQDDEAAPGEPAASVTFSEQETDGTSVVVDEVTMDEGGFVTIHDSSLLEGAVIESVIGVSEYLEAGTHEDVEVEFDEPLEEDDTLIAMPHLDTNDNQEYDFVETEGEEDGPYVTEDGEPVTDDALVTVEDAPEEDPEEDVPEEDPEEDPVVMDPDHDAVVEGVPVAGPGDVTVTIEQLTIEDLTIENANVTVFVIGEDVDLEDLDEIMEEVDDEEVDDEEVDDEEIDDEEIDDEEVDDEEVDDEEIDDEEIDDEEVDDEEIDDEEIDDEEVDDEEVDDEEIDDEEVDDEEVDDEEIDDEEVDDEEVDDEEIDDEEVADLESFTIEDLQAPETATVGDTILVNATITNPNEEEATQDVEFRLQGDLVESQEVTLEGDESDTVEFEIDTTDVPAGEYVHMILTDAFGDVAFIELLEEADDDDMDDDAVDDEDVDDEEADDEEMDDEADDEDVGDDDNDDEEAPAIAPIAALNVLGFF